mmetsp:Transcript_19250/g.47921  ORF Transcript_19250/g.47921 Transcript_19250/m.47921 type:complete len:87 (-) Transcript_19250:225-485(-)
MCRVPRPAQTKECHCHAISTTAPAPHTKLSRLAPCSCGQSATPADAPHCTLFYPTHLTSFSAAPPRLARQHGFDADGTDARALESR